MLPDHPDFCRWLACPPPNWKESYSKTEFPVLALTPDSSVPVFLSPRELDELIIDAGLYSDDSEDEESLCYYPSYE